MPRATIGYRAPLLVLWVQAGYVTFLLSPVILTVLMVRGLWRSGRGR